MIRIRESRTAGLVLLCVLLCLCSCKRKVAAAPPTPKAVPAVTEAVRTAAPTITIRADRPTLTRGESATLTVSTQNATSVTIEPGVGTVPVNGSRQVSPNSSVTYVATAIGPGGTAGDSIRLTVNVPTPTAVATPIRAVAPVNNPTPTPVSLDQRIQQVMQPILFDYDKADIRSDQMDKMQAEAAFLKENPALRFLIEGHCDDRGSEEYNQALGERRASAIKSYLLSHGIQESRLSIISYGEERPACREETEDCYTKNRRGAYTRIP